MSAVIVTHSGAFHADEALACAMLRMLPQYKNAEIKRSREPEQWAAATVLVDVGGVYDPENLKFDHHQRTFNDFFSENYKTRLSSAGLIYKHFGKLVIKEILAGADVTDADVDLIHEKIYQDFIEGFDGVDNGVPQYAADITPAYKYNASISDIVRFINPLVFEESNPEVKPDERFIEAMDLCGRFFKRTVLYWGRDWIPARSDVMDALVNRAKVHASGEIIEFKKFVVWKSILPELEESLGIANKIKFVIFPGEKSTYRIQAVPIKAGSFESRLPLPQPWRGLSTTDLDAVTKVDGGVFVHATGFMGGHQTRDGALKLAEMTLAMQ